MRNSRITAVLGPTNTGKTHYAIERMLAHKSGVIGLPLRLLAREVYDRIVALRGPSVVALVTGEERIMPARPAYWVCTVEAMPVDIGAEFLAVDEIQLCEDHDRGHIFTARLLHARGLSETLFLGAETMRARIAELVPHAEFQKRERFSKLSYAGSRKISRLPPRSAIVGFSVDNVYAIAELVRRQKGGAAIVMGALSPRTRNAQVEMYQNGDVDYLVATDAIGMGLNLDVAHVAFSSVSKFDGHRMRLLRPNELAQIAGRAGRFTTDGTFGVTGEVTQLDPDGVEAIENNNFQPVHKINWRNSRLEFGSVGALLKSLEKNPDHSSLIRARDADDHKTLRDLAAQSDLMHKISSARDVRLLWDVCQLPDFRNISSIEHSNLAGQIFDFLVQYGAIPEEWFAKRVKMITNTTGNIDTIAKRLAFIRTWTYVAQRKDWLRDPEAWREQTRIVEDQLSDALHQLLTQRFVDRRSSVLMRRLKQKESLVAEVNEKGEVTVEGEFVGRLDGFRFHLDKDASPEEAKTVRAAAYAALAPQFMLRADKFYNAPDTEFDVTEQGGLMWGEQAVGKLTRGHDPMSPQITVFVDEEAGQDVIDKVSRRLSHWFERKKAAVFEPVFALKNDETITGLARGIAFQLVDAMGIIPRGKIAREIKELDQDGRGLLRKNGVRFGQYTLFMPAILKPAPTRLRLVLWGIWENLDEIPSAPPPGLVTIPAVEGEGLEYYTKSGFRLAGQRAIRIDMLERLADLIRPFDVKNGFESTSDMLSITGLSLEMLADLLQGLGYQVEKGERVKERPTPQKLPETPENPAEAAQQNSEENASMEVAESEKPEPVEAQNNDAAPEMESFYIFKWVPQKRAERHTQKPERKQKAKRPPKEKREQRPARAQVKEEKPIDPDNPFAALAALKKG